MSDESNSAADLTRADRSSERAPHQPGELTEDQAVALLKQSDVVAETLALISRSPRAATSRKVMLALALHPRTPRHLAIPILRRLFTFDLMQVTLASAVAADIKRVAEDQLLNRLQSLSLGERISLARRASGRVAGALLSDPDQRVITAALGNSRLTENFVVAALLRNDASNILFEIVSTHPEWSQRREVQIALLRSEKTPLGQARELAMNFSQEFLRQIVPEARKEELANVAGGTKEYRD